MYNDYENTKREALEALFVKQMDQQAEAQKSPGTKFCGWELCECHYTFSRSL
jgi:hypothetical protein